MNGKIAKIRFVFTDVDGVLTNGKVFYADGKLYRAFNIHDGIAFRMLAFAGIKTGIVSGKKSEETKKRFAEMGVDYYFEGIENKIGIMEKLVSENKITWRETCYLGDDLPDMPVMNKAGIAVAPANAVQEIKKAADYTCEKTGGNGAFREAAELILKGQKKWEDILKKFFAC